MLCFVLFFSPFFLTLLYGVLHQWYIFKGFRREVPYYLLSCVYPVLLRGCAIPNWAICRDAS